MELNRLLYHLKALSLLFLACGCTLKKSDSSIDSRVLNKPNILLIAVDDLNDWVGVLEGHPDVMTPNIDALAKSGVLFRNAHTQVPLCAPSRVALLTGKQPSSTGVYFQIKDTFVREASLETESAIYLPQYFEQNGYKTMGAGKIWHGNDEAKTFQEYGEAKEWFGPRPKKRINYDPEQGPNYDGFTGTNTDWGAFPETDEEMSDHYFADWAIDKLQQTHSDPFFLAVGFVRPHVPWYVPPAWLEKYDPETIALPPYKADDLDDLPQYAKELTSTPPMPTTEYLLERGDWNEAVRAYLASVTWTDHQVGRVLEALKESPYAENTIIVLFSDHGYHMGEKNRFAKMSLWERDTHVPLIFSGPGIPEETQISKPAGLIDIYPTLLKLTGLDSNPDLEGRSLDPLFSSPDLEWPYPVRTTFGPGNIALRSERYRYIRYEDGSEELYDHQEDPLEWNNLLANTTERSRYSEIIEEFQSHVPTSWAPMAEMNYYTQNRLVRDRLEEWKKDPKIYFNKPLQYE